MSVPVKVETFLHKQASTPYAERCSRRGENKAKIQQKGL